MKIIYEGSDISPGKRFGVFGNEYMIVAGNECDSRGPWYSYVPTGGDGPGWLGNRFYKKDDLAEFMNQNKAIMR